MNVLITGIDGFTGKHLETFLNSKGYKVFGTVLEASTRVNHIKCNICNRSDVDSVIAQVQPDYVFHFAAISFVGENNKSLIYNVNVLGTQNILESLLGMSKLPRKIVIASSATVYGNQSKTILDESMCPYPVNHYGYSKLAMEHMLGTYFKKLNILITRPFNYTGIGHNENFIIPKIVNHFKKKKKSIELGNLDVAREFNDVRTVIEIYSYLMTVDIKSQVINICTGNVVSLKDIIKYMEDMAGYKIEINVNPLFIRENEIPTLSGSTKKLSQIINIENKYSIKDTLKLMYLGVE